LNLQNSFQNFYFHYPFLEFSELVEYYLFFGGSEEFINLPLHSFKTKELFSEIAQIEVLEKLPFFLFDEPFRTLLVTLALNDAKVDSTFIKSKTSLSFKDDILKELEENGIIYIEYSREEPLKLYSKQKIKKEFKHYTIQNKIRFTTPFYHFLFAFIVPFLNKDFTLNQVKAQEAFSKNSNRLSSLWFEHLSKELIRYSFKNVTKCFSYWDRFSEFDLYCEVNKEKFLVGECKYTHKPITKVELLKLEAKIEKSQLKSDYIAFFSKGGYSKELEKLKRNNLLLFNLEDFKKLL
jgi:hypothetical protein